MTIDSIDVFENNTRTSYDTTVRCITKHKHDIKDFRMCDNFGYDFRIAVSTEENVYNESIHNIGVEKHLKLQGTTMRKKHRFRILSVLIFRST